MPNWFDDSFIDAADKESDFAAALASYTILESDSGNSTISAFGRRWTPDGWRRVVDPQYIGKRVYPFTDSIGRECLQVEGTEGRAGRFTVVYENIGA